MYPYINIGSLHLGTFGLLLWLAAVAGALVLHRNFVRSGVVADALNVVAFVVIAGVIGAKLWHELQDPAELSAAMKIIFKPGMKQPLEVLFGFLHWFQAGFAWFGGMVAGILMLMYQGMDAKPNGMRGLKAGVRMLDLATVSAAVGYGVGRIGCLTSGDGDYGKNTTSAWGVHMANGADVYHRALVQPSPANALVWPTPLYEFVFALALAWILWKLAGKARPLGWLTGFYLCISGVGRFLVEFVRINPRLYWGMSNAQVAALGSVLFGLILMLAVRGNEPVGGLQELPAEVSEVPSPS